VRASEMNLFSKEYAVKQQSADLMVLQKFTKKRKEIELKAKADDADRELVRTKKSQDAATEKAKSEHSGAVKTAELEKQQLVRLKAQLDKCVVTAPQDGIVIYFSRPWDQESRIKPGVTINEQSPIFTLPDLDQMQVKLRIHESVIKKVQVGQTATMVVQAQRNQILHGKVKSVGSVAENDGWRGGGAKEYSTQVSIEDLPKEAGLRPGMSADVKILIKTIDNALTVPVQAVTELDNKHVAYIVAASGAIEKREVTVGDSNEQLIQVLTGLAAGDRVALDARNRAAAETKRKASQQPGGKSEQPAKPGTQSVAKS
jgi:HlyD family secretion protein